MKNLMKNLKMKLFFIAMFVVFVGQCQIGQTPTEHTKGAKLGVIPVLTVGDTINLPDDEGIISQIAVSDMVNSNNIATYLGNEVLKGGYINIGAYEYTVRVSKYVIDGTIYNDITIVSPLTLTGSHATLDRIDLIVIDNTGAISAIAGTPSANPFIPDYNKFTQAPFFFVYVKALSTEPTDPDTGNPVITNNLIYDENLGEATEWTATTTLGDADVNSVIDASNGTKSVEFPLGDTFRTVRFLDDVVTNVADIETFSFKIKFTGIPLSPKLFRILFSNDGTADSSFSIPFYTDSYGIGSDPKGAIPLNTWIQVVIPSSDIGITNFNNITFETSTLPINFRIDELNLQGGTTGTIGGGNTITHTSQLINDGEDTFNPFITLADLYSGNAVIIGSYLWDSGYTFNVQADKYIINNTLYSNNITDVVTLGASHATLDRIDAIVINSNGVFEVVEGLASANPFPPSIDGLTQVRLVFILVTAGTVQPPSIVNELVYDENLGAPSEWDVGQLSNVDPSNLSDAQNGITSILHSSSGNSSYMYITRPTALTLTDVNNISFYVKILVPETERKIGNVYFADESNANLMIDISDGVYGFDGNNLDWQQIIVPKSDLLPHISSISYMLFSRWLYGDALLYDNVIVQSGIDAVGEPTTQNDLQQAYNNSSTAPQIITNGIDAVTVKGNHITNSAFEVIRTDDSSIISITPLSVLVQDAGIGIGSTLAPLEYVDINTNSISVLYGGATRASIGMGNNTPELTLREGGFNTTVKNLVTPTQANDIRLQNGSGTLAFLTDIVGGSSQTLQEVLTAGNQSDNTGGIVMEVGANQIVYKNNRIEFSKDRTTAYNQTTLEAVLGASAQITLPAETSQLLGDVSTQTVTNKSLDAVNNTVTNIGFAEFDTDTSDLMGFANAIALDSPIVTVTSNGFNTSLNIERSGGGDIRFIFSDGIHIHDTTPPEQVILTSGSDVSPQKNFVYILQSTKALTASTVGFPSAEHAPIATVLVQSVASVQTDGAYKVHAWTDHATSSDGMGHLAHLNSWIRSRPAGYVSGITTTPTTGIGTFTVAISSGVIKQLHDHTFPARVTPTDPIFIFNDFTTPYLKVTDPTTVLTDALGNSMSNSRFNIIIWGSVNESESDCKIFWNLPTGAYNNDSDAIDDTNKTGIYTFPDDYAGTGFLIARLTVRHISSSNTWSILQNESLLGKFPSTSAGGSSGSNITQFPDNVFNVHSNLDNTKEILFDASAITTGNARTITMADFDVDLSVGKFIRGTDPLDAVYMDGNVGIGTNAPVSALHINKGTGATSGITFNSGGSSVYEVANQFLQIMTGTSFAFVNGGLIATSFLRGAGILNEDPSATNPVFLPSRADFGTGIGSASNGEFSLIANSIEIVNVNSSGIDVSGLITATGNITGSNLSGINTGDQILIDLATTDAPDASNGSGIIKADANLISVFDQDLVFEEIIAQNTTVLRFSDLFNTAFANKQEEPFNNKSGTTIDLSNTAGNLMNLTGANATNIYTLQGAITGGNAILPISTTGANAAAFPTVTGASEWGGSSFETATNYQMEVWDFGAQGIKYWFIRTDSGGGSVSSGLESLNEGNGIGWRLKGIDPLNYGNIGLNAIDLSICESASSTYGATGDYSFTTGSNTFASGNSGVAMGYLIENNGISSFNTGINHKDSGYTNFISGIGHDITGMNTTAIGQASEIVNEGIADFNPTNKTLFVIGNGTIQNGNTLYPVLTRSNAFKVEYNGDVSMPSYGSGTKTGTPTYNLTVDVNGNIIEDALSAGGGTQFYTAEHENRAYCLTTNDWIGLGTYGLTNSFLSTSKGVGATPTHSDADMGLIQLPIGAVLDRLEIMQISVSSEITDMDFQMSAIGTDYTVETNGLVETVIVAPVSLNTPTTVASNGLMTTIDLADYTMTGNRTLTYAFKPVGTLTATRYMVYRMKLYYTLP